MDRRVWIAGILTLLALAPIVLGPASAQPADSSSAASQPRAADRDYVLGPADVIEVDVLGRSDFKIQARISEAGTIQLPYIGTTVAANRTTTQLADEVTAALEKGGFFSRPVVSVQIVSYASRYVTVLGEVERPGLTPVDRPYHLSEILARVGGVKETGADYVVLVDPKGRVHHYSVSALATGDPSQDPYVSPGDRIFSPKAEIFYVSGQVKAPGSYPIDPNLTVRMAIARAGGISDEGSMGKVKVTHRGGRATREDLNAMVQPGDIIVVGTRLF